MSDVNPEGNLPPVHPEDAKDQVGFLPVEKIRKKAREALDRPDMGRGPFASRQVFPHPTKPPEVAGSQTNTQRPIETKFAPGLYGEPSQPSEPKTTNLETPTLNFPGVQEPDVSQPAHTPPARKDS